MPSLASVFKVDLPIRSEQAKAKQCAQGLFSPSFPQVQSMMRAFDSRELKARKLCKPLDDYSSTHDLKDHNQVYIRLSLEYSVWAIEGCIAAAGLTMEEITDIIVVATTGLASPSLVARIDDQTKPKRLY